METKKQFRGESGATMIETALAIPIVILVIFAVIEFARILTAQGILNAAAMRTVSLASVLPGVTNEDPETNPAGLTPQEEALATLREFATILPLSTLFTEEQSPDGLGLYQLVSVERNGVIDPVEIVLPETSTGQSLEQRLETEPIVVQIHARLRSLIPFIGSIRVVGKAVGFRESRNNSSIPAALDCAGNPIAGNATPDFLNCRCISDPDDPRRVQNQLTGGCDCRGNGAVFNSSTDTCECTQGFVEAADGSFNCVCDKTCGGTGEFLNRASCQCETCGDGFVLNEEGTGCECAATSCGGDEFQSSFSCGCLACPENQVQNPNNPNSCICSEETLANPSCGTNEYFHPGTCRCYPCQGLATPNDEGTSCLCTVDPGSVSCPDGQTFSTSQCSCVTCFGNYVPDLENPGSCTCPLTEESCGEGQELVGCSCRCKQNCGEREIAVLRDGACSCECTGSIVGGRCAPAGCTEATCTYVDGEWIRPE